MDTEQGKDLLNASYFHSLSRPIGIVFTLPDTLNELALVKPAVLYQLLFRTAWSVVRDFAANPKLLGAKTGMVSVLHIPIRFASGQAMGTEPKLTSSSALHCPSWRTNTFR